MDRELLKNIKEYYEKEIDRMKEAAEEYAQHSVDAMRFESVLEKSRNFYETYNCNLAGRMEAAIKFIPDQIELLQLKEDNNEKLG
jgi:hypothetical protein